MNLALPKPILKLNLNGELEKEYPSVGSASKDGYLRYAIRQCANGVYKQMYGYQWKWKE